MYSSLTTDPRLANGNGDGAIPRSNVALNGIPDAMKLRATEILDSIVFTYTPGVTTTKERNIVLTIPGGWTQPVIDNNDGINEAGEITINQGTVSIGAGGGGWQISTGSYDPAPSTPVVITYKRVTVPKRAGAYHFNFTSNVVGPGHVSQLDSHLQSHARQVVTIADQNAGNIGHGDLGSLDFVQGHSHTGATWTITLAIHTHAGDGSITHVSPHMHTLNADTPNDPNDLLIADVVDHAHSGAGEAVLAARGHTHGGDNQPITPVGDHSHGGNGMNVSVAKSHSHAVGTSPNEAINVHTHPGAGLDNPPAPTHSHAAPTGTATNVGANEMVLAHTHDAATNGVDITTVADHGHSGNDQGVTSVPFHAHAAVNSPYDSTTWEKGPDHAHTGDNGRVSYVEPHVHSYTAPGTVTGPPTTPGYTGASHTHDIGEAATLRTQPSTSPVTHVHASATGGVHSAGTHAHLDTDTSGGSPLHKHSNAGGSPYDTTIPPLNDHDHDPNTSGPNAAQVDQGDPDLRHEHTPNYRSILSVLGHTHASLTTAGGSPNPYA